MWTDETVALTKRLWAEGLSAAQIARQIGAVSRSAVLGKLHRLGANRRITPSRPASNRRPRVRGNRVVLPKVKAEKTPPITDAELTRIAALEPTGPLIEHTDKHHCRYIKGEPGTPVCGRPIHADSLCAEHHKLCWLPNKKRPSPPPFMLRSLRCEA